jgi:DNA-binding transcriptional MerR regulator
VAKVARGKALVAKLRAQAGVRDPEALAAWLGRFKKARKRGLSVKAAKKAADGNSKNGSSKKPAQGVSSNGSSKSKKKKKDTSMPAGLGMGGEFMGRKADFAPGALDKAEKARAEIGRKHRAELAARAAKRKQNQKATSKPRAETQARTQQASRPSQEIGSAINANDTKTIKSMGASGQKYIAVRLANGREGLIVNKYGPEWWKRATKKDIRSVIVY